MADEAAVPILGSRDLAATLAFYERLGFRETGTPFQRWRYLIVGRGGISLHFFESAELDPLTTNIGCYLYVRDAQALYEEWEPLVEHDPATGSRIMAPNDTDYGLREFAVVDPNGNLLRVGSPMP